jgi:hypothetical protein
VGGDVPLVISNSCDGLQQYPLLVFTGTASGTDTDADTDSTDLDLEVSLSQSSGYHSASYSGGPGFKFRPGDLLL